MLSRVSQLWSSRTPARSKRFPSSGGLAFRPRLEGFEDRVVPAALTNLAPALAAPAAASPLSLLPINITGATLVQDVTGAVTGVVNIVGTIGGQIQNLAGRLSLTPAADGTPILQLHLDAIHLNVLGLKVDTSDICLDITASTGPGQLLGNLLSGLGGTLPTLQNALAGLDLGGVGSELTQILNQGLGLLFSPTSVNAGGTSVTSAGSTSILHLSLGPVNVNLLGLNVSLDNCATPPGPVTVDITAQSGPGQLLGNLLTSVTHLLDGPANGNALANALNRVAGAINNILTHL